MNRRGRPYPATLRQRVVRLMLDDGLGPSEVARRLLIDRSTVYRYRRAAAEQQRDVPLPPTATCAARRTAPS